MQVELSQSQSELIEDLLRQGRYQTVDQAIEAALELLRGEIDGESSRQDTLKNTISEAFDDLNDGKAEPLDAELVVARMRQQAPREDLPKVDSRALGTDAAVTDLERIWRIVARENADAADNQVRKLADRCRRISTMPSMGRPRPELGERVQSVVAQRFVIYYLMQGLTLIALRFLPVDA